jgi:hypothetical protein
VDLDQHVLRSRARLRHLAHLDVLGTGGVDDLDGAHDGEAIEAG